MTHLSGGLGVLHQSECLKITITNTKPNGASSVSILDTTVVIEDEDGRGERGRRGERDRESVCIPLYYFYVHTTYLIAS